MWYQKHGVLIHGYVKHDASNNLFKQKYVSKTKKKRKPMLKQKGEPNEQ